MSRIQLKVVRLSSSSLCDEVLNDLLNYPKTSPPHGLGRFTYPMKERLQLNNDWWTSMDSLYNITVTLYLYLMITGPLSFQQGHKYSKSRPFQRSPILCKHVWIITDKKGCRNLCSRPQMPIWTKIRPKILIHAFFHMLVSFHLEKIDVIRGHSTTTWTEFCHFDPPNAWTIYTLSVDKNIHFLTPSPPHLLHVVIEWPLTTSCGASKALRS